MWCLSAPPPPNFPSTSVGFFPRSVDYFTPSVPSLACFNENFFPGWCGPRGVPLDGSCQPGSVVMWSILLVHTATVCALGTRACRLSLLLFGVDRVNIYPSFSPFAFPLAIFRTCFLSLLYTIYISVVSCPVYTCWSFSFWQNHILSPLHPLTPHPFPLIIFILCLSLLVQLMN